MGAPQLIIKPAQMAQLSEISFLHQRALGYSINSRLGVEHLQRLYSYTFADVASCVMAAWLESQLVGVVSATLDFERLSLTIRNRLLQKWWQYFGTVLKRPEVWSLLWESLQMTSPVKWQGREVRPCLTAIAVDESKRRHGIGRGLVAAVDQFMRQQGAACYWLDTLATNTPAQEFYRRLGFVETERRSAAIVFVRDLLTT